MLSHVSQNYNKDSNALHLVKQLYPFRTTHFSFNSIFSIPLHRAAVSENDDQ